MQSPAAPRIQRPRRAWSTCATSLGRAICGAVDGTRARLAHLVEAARVFETAPPSAHVLAAAIVGAAPSAIPHLSGVILAPAVKAASQAIVAVIAAHASARILERAGHRVGLSTLLGDAIAHGRGARASATPRLAFRLLAGRLSTGALDLVPGVGDARRLLEATEGALLAARFVALAERHATACVEARATRLCAQEPLNDNDAALELELEATREWALA